MKFIKTIIEYIKNKPIFATNKTTSNEERYTIAANRIIDEITKLEKAHTKSINEEKRLRKMAEEKLADANKKDREIRAKIKNGMPVETLAKLAILYRRSSDVLTKKADDLVEMRIEIAKTVVELDNTRQDLAAKLELIRATKSAEELGIVSADDVVELASLTKIDINDIMMRIETFGGEKTVEVNDFEVESYIKSIV